MKRNYALPSGFHLACPAPAPACGGGPLAIVVPVPRAALTADERLSLATLRQRSGGVPVLFVVPEGCHPETGASGVRLIEVPAAAMASIGCYNRMMMTSWFYRLFAGYRTILLFQLDCLLLREDLAAWAARDWSYVGAPWFARRGSHRLKGVGNGGLSLRRPDHALAVLESDRFHPWPRFAQQWRHFASLKHLGILRRTLATAQRTPADGRTLAERFVAAFPRPEDEFWGLYAPFFAADYRVPSPTEALDFAFEARPRDAYALTGGRLPLGCHAWGRMDREFWSERLAEQGLDAQEMGELQDAPQTAAVLSAN